MKVIVWVLLGTLGGTGLIKTPCLSQKGFQITIARILAISSAVTEYANDHLGLLPTSPEVPAYEPASQLDDPARQFEKTPFKWSSSRDFPSGNLANQLFPRYLIHGDKVEFYRNAWGKDIYYSVSSDRHHFILYTYGRDGKRDDTYYYNWPISGHCDIDRDIIRNEHWFISFPADVAR